MSEEIPTPPETNAATPAPTEPATPPAGESAAVNAVAGDTRAETAGEDAVAATSHDAPAPASDSATEDAGELPPAPDEVTLLNSLKQVVDPELFVNIVDLGLIYAIQEEDHKVTVDMTLTSPACPAGPQLISQAKQTLEALPGVKEATIKLVMSPPWGPDRMTDEARDQLGIF